MPPLTAPTDELAALAQGRAAVDLAGYRAVRVGGGDARHWLHDLVTTDVASLRAGEGRRSLLLDPTGHIRADLQVACDGEGFWLFQAPDAPEPIGTALAPYVLSADVRLDESGGDRHLVALPGSDEGPGDFSPSVLGPGHDLLVDGAGPTLPAGRVLVGVDAAEVWRIRGGRARMGVDFDRTSIPAEAGLDGTIDATKGCFLGQESVARVRNLGHPPRVLLHLTSDGPIEPRTRVVDEGGDEAGTVTSAAARDESGTVLLASVLWQAREGALRSSDGVPLVPVGSSD